MRSSIVTCEFPAEVENGVMSTTVSGGGPSIQRAASRPSGSAARQGVSVFLRAPFSRRTWAANLYALVGFPLGIAGFILTVFTTVFGIGISLSVTGLLIGPPLLAASALGARGLGGVHRGLARGLLGLKVATPAPFQPRPGVIGWIRSGLTDAVGWRARGYLVLKFPVAVASFVAAVVPWGMGLYAVFAPVPWAFGADFNTINDHGVIRHSIAQYGGFYFDTAPKMLLLVAQGVVILLVAPWVLRVVLMLDRALIHGLLGPTSLTERVRDLEQTRAHAVDDSAARLRSIERDLHDGAQAQLVAVAMKLSLAKEKLGGGLVGVQPEVDVARAYELVDTAQRTAAEAINELRDLARGIHPPVLDSGLDAALATLAARSAVPVELVVHVPDRPSAAIETIAYFCAAELLTNVAKHSGARHAVLEAVQVPGMLRIRVTDDGTGGASLDSGSGLRGLAERLRTVDGRLDVHSPRGGPTVVTVELPSRT
jgi:signal transduction histidine kinase